jgi:signal peptidase I
VSFSWFLAQAQQPPLFSIESIDRIARAPISQVLMFAAVLTLVRILVFLPLKNQAVHARGAGYKVMKAINELADALVYAAIAVFLLIRPFAIQTFFIPTGSMINTLQLRDFIVANKFIYRASEPQRGDIIVFHPPKPAFTMMGGQETDYIKRLIGVPGDVIELRNKKLYRNGQPVDEPYVTYTTGREQSILLPRDEWDAQIIPDFKLVNDNGRIIPLAMLGGYANMQMAGPVSPEFVVNDLTEMRRLMDLPAAPIPPGYFLFMGDNRNGSFDSRGWGLVPRDQIIGKAEFIWLPLSRIRQVR